MLHVFESPPHDPIGSCGTLVRSAGDGKIPLWTPAVQPIEVPLQPRTDVAQAGGTRSANHTDARRLAPDTKASVASIVSVDAPTPGSGTTCR